MDLEELEQLVRDHSPMLANDGMLEERVERIPPELHETLHYKFLLAVLYYNAQHKAKEPESKDWQGAAERFLALQEQDDATPFLAFYIPNYLLLAYRNAGGTIEILEPIFEQARAAAGNLDGPVKDQILGFLLYNWSRLLHKLGRVDEAVSFYNLAGTHRVRFYQHMKQSDADEDVLKGVATQVWKIRHDWLALFPGKDIRDCTVSEELYAEVGSSANPEFSAQKSIVKGATVVGLLLFLFLGDPLARYVHQQPQMRNDNNGEFLQRAA